MDPCAGLALLAMGFGIGCRYGYWRRRPTIVDSHGEPEWERRPVVLDVLGYAFASVLLLAYLAGTRPPFWGP